LIELKNITKIYFLGIGGIGMSAVARYFHARGIDVSGYDKTRTSLTAMLEESGIIIHYEDDVNLIPKDVQLVVYTPAIPQSALTLSYYREHGYTVLKRSEVLEIISSQSFNICVAGTHGKTTITTMIAHILRHSEYGCNAFLGGIATNYNTNFWSSSRNVCVIEADEYDRSFLRLHPDIAIVSSMDADHLDIYGTEEALQQAFIDFSAKVKPGGLLLKKFGLKRGSEMKAGKQITYSLQNENADVYAADIRLENGGYLFDAMMKDSILDAVALHMGGMHNIENAMAAISVAHQLGISEHKIKAAVEAFKGVKRRFEYIIKNDRLVYIDDYAHHPEELKAMITGAKTLFKGKRCTVIFQPHLFSRTKDLADEFAKSLDLADNIILLPIYPARELPVEGVSSALILNKLESENKNLLTKEACMDYIKSRYLTNMNHEFGEVLITAGAGDIDMMVDPIKKAIETAL